MLEAVCTRGAFRFRDSFTIESDPNRRLGKEARAPTRG